MDKWRWPKQGALFKNLFIKFLVIDYLNNLDIASCFKITRSNAKESFIFSQKSICCCCIFSIYLEEIFFGNINASYYIFIFSMVIDAVSFNFVLMMALVKVSLKILQSYAFEGLIRSYLSSRNHRQLCWSIVFHKHLDPCLAWTFVGFHCFVQLKTFKPNDWSIKQHKETEPKLKRIIRY